MDNEKINAIVTAIKKQYADKSKYPMEHEIRKHVFLHFALMDCIHENASGKDTIPCGDSKDVEIEELKIELQKVFSGLSTWSEQLNNVHNYLCSLTRAKPTLKDGEMIGLDVECIHKIDSLVPNGDKLGELIDKVQHRIPNLPAMGRFHCHHLGKMLSAAIKDNGK